MLKPNYHSKVIGKDYKIGYEYGNNYFDFKGTRGIFELLINGYIIRIIPHYDVTSYPFPPATEDYIRIAWEPKNMQESRMFSFFFCHVIFFEFEERAGESFHFVSDGDRPEHLRDEDPCLIHCIDHATYQDFVKKIKESYEKIWREGITPTEYFRRHLEHTALIPLLDQKFEELKDLLPGKFRESLEI